MPTVNAGTDGRTPVELYYEDHGDGRPVVLIHGWPLSNRSWEAQTGALVDAGFRVVAYDRRGFGWSSQPRSGYEYDTLAADLGVLMDHLDLRDATLVGFSMGGGEVARYIGTHGTDRVAQAVFAAAIPPALKQTSDNPDGGVTDEVLAGFQAEVRKDRMAFLEGFMTNFFSAGGELKVSDAQRRYALELAQWASPKGTHDCIAAWGSDFRADLERCDVPVLVIHGDSDAIVPVEVSGRRTAETVKDGRLHVIPGGPHGINASHAEEFNRVLLDFLRDG